MQQRVRNGGRDSATRMDDRSGFRCRYHNRIQINRRTLHLYIDLGRLAECQKKRARALRNESNSPDLDNVWPTNFQSLQKKSSV